MLHSEFQRHGYDAEAVVGLADQEAIEYMLRVSGFVWRNYRSIESLEPTDWDQLSAVVLKTGVCGAMECVDKFTTQSKLVYLEVPVSVLSATLPQIAKLRSLRYLVVSGEGSGSIDKFVLDQIHSLEGIDAKLKVNVNCLPNLRDLHIRDKPKGMIANLANGLGKLVSLTLCPYNDPSMHQIENSTLRFVRLFDGDAESISSLTRFQSLTNVHIQNLGRLTSIEPLLTLSMLRELSICYCNRIRDIELLSELPSLERLKVYACKIELKVLEQRLGNRLLELSI